MLVGPPMAGMRLLLLSHRAHGIAHRQEALVPGVRASPAMLSYPTVQRNHCLSDEYLAAEDG
ncbi:hypothetical protein AWB68_06763 [Caballeronia choica]|uniref:Uncharacterized protein n=1 Tax=Caballeronia choica TaxID=326476 RepID=A0A158KR43_9BURK|nr:hypothetical protein AWB68_06763 [Caballeronia choica]